MSGLLLSALLYLYCICICICTRADVRVYEEQLEGKGWRDDSHSTCNSYIMSLYMNIHTSEGFQQRLSGAGR